MLAGVNLFPAPAGWNADEERAAIVDLTQWMSEAWDAGDAATYGELFAADCDYVAFDGTRLKGRDENMRHHRALFDTVLKGSRLVFEGAPQIRFLSRDVAVMHAWGSVLLPWQSRVTPQRRSIQTYVVVRERDGCWRITAFHNTRYRPLKVPRGWRLTLILLAMRARAGLSRQDTGR
jgi:uncharacterized protein (TIGR02246 family)